MVDTSKMILIPFTKTQDCIQSIRAYVETNLNKDEKTLAKDISLTYLYPEEDLILVNDTKINFPVKFEAGADKSEVCSKMIDEVVKLINITNNGELPINLICTTANSRSQFAVEMIYDKAERKMCLLKPYLAKCAKEDMKERLKDFIEDQIIINSDESWLKEKLHKDTVILRQMNEELSKDLINSCIDEMCALVDIDNISDEDLNKKLRDMLMENESLMLHKMMSGMNSRIQMRKILYSIKNLKDLEKNNTTEYIEDLKKIDVDKADIRSIITDDQKRIVIFSYAVIKTDNHQYIFGRDIVLNDTNQKGVLKLFRGDHLTPCRMFGYPHALYNWSNGYTKI